MNDSSSKRVHKQMYLFALFFVLYEFTVYAANDMILPGMLKVVHEFNVSVNFIALTLVFYILGNALLQLFLGPLAERYEKRRLLLGGNVVFVITSFLLIFTQNMPQFLFIRTIEGFGAAVIAVGYSLIHENFSDEKAVKLIALMGNVAVMAPLVGPIIGSIIVNYLHWRFVFGLIVVMSLITLWALKKLTPANKKTDKTPLSWSTSVKEYAKVVKNSNFRFGVFIISVVFAPSIAWIGLAPTMLLDKLHLTYFSYNMYQLIAIGGFSACSIMLQFSAGKLKPAVLLKIGTSLIACGVLFSVSGIFVTGKEQLWLISIALFVHGFGAGMCNGMIIRLILSEKGCLANYAMSMMVFIQMLMLLLSLNLINLIMSLFDFKLTCFSLVNSIAGFIVSGFIMVFAKRYKSRAWQ